MLLVALGLGTLPVLGAAQGDPEPEMVTLPAISEEALQASQGVLYRLGERDSEVFSASPAVIDGWRILPDIRLLESLPEVLVLALPDNGSVVARYSGGELRGSGRGTWRGWNDGRRVVLTLEAGFVVGRIETPDGLYEIQPLPSGGQALARIDTELYPPCGGGVESSYPGSTGAPADNTGRDPVDRIDVMSVYTPQARDAAGGVGAITATIQSAVDVTNTAFIDSNMLARFNLVHTALANYNDSGNSSTDLSWVANDPGVAMLRDQYAADLVSLIPEDGGGYCGRGYVMRYPSSSFEAYAFQVTARVCAVGNLSWAHEHGHNMGFEHDPANGATPGQASYPWSFGHFVDGSYRTVMSYSNQCTSGCTRVAHFSNPSVNHLGSPTGIADTRDNHRAGDLTALIATDFRIAADDKDIVIQSLGTSPTTVDAGLTTTASYSVVNQGTTTITESYREDIYLSVDATFDGGDTYLTSSNDHTTDLSPGGSYSGSETLTIPVATSAGSYYLLVVATPAARSWRATSQTMSQVCKSRSTPLVPTWS